MIKNTGIILSINATLYAKLNLPNSWLLTNKFNIIRAPFTVKCVEVDDKKRCKFSLRFIIIFFNEKL